MFIQTVTTRFHQIIFVICALLFAACGGGGGPDTPNPPPQEEMVKIGGVATKGPIRGAFVNVYLLDKNGNKSTTPLNSNPVVTDENGDYSLSMPKTLEPIVIEVSGGSDSSYISEVTGKTIVFSQNEKLKAIVPSYQNYNNISITPLTNAAYDRVQFIKQNNPSTDILSIITEANTYVAKQNNLTDIIAKPDKNYNAVLTLLQQVIETNPNSSTTLLASKLKEAVTTVSGLESYKTDIQTAASSLPTNVLSSITNEVNNIKNAVVSATSPVNITVPPVVNYTPQPTEPTTPAATVTTPAIPSATIETIAPIAPKNLSATTIASGTSATISWDASTPGAGSTVAITGYEIYRGLTNSISSASLVASQISTSFTDTPLVPDSTYYYWVKAVNANKIYSVFSNYLLVKTTSNLPLSTPMSVSTSGSIQ